MLGTMTTIYVIYIFHKKLIYLKSILIQNIYFMIMNTGFLFHIFIIFFFRIFRNNLIQNVVSIYYC